MAVRVEVELDIFSGMPNPTWVLTDAEADSFMRRLAAVSGTSAGELSDNLGYRGFIVHMTQGAHTQLIRIQNGAVHISNDATIRASDKDRELERWLLNIGRPHLKNDISEAVEREFQARSPSARATPPQAPDTPRQRPTSTSPNVP
jgi:hypothetical protein